MLEKTWLLLTAKKKTIPNVWPAFLEITNKAVLGQWEKHPDLVKKLRPTIMIKNWFSFHQFRNQCFKLTSKFFRRIWKQNRRSNAFEILNTQKKRKRNSHQSASPQLFHNAQNLGCGFPLTIFGKKYRLPKWSKSNSVVNIWKHNVSTIYQFIF